MTLSESEKRTIVTALAHENTHAARHVLEELERQGVRIPVWVQERKP